MQSVLLFDGRQSRDQKNGSAQAGTVFIFRCPATTGLQKVSGKLQGGESVNISFGLEKRRTRSRTITDSHAWAQQRLREIEREGKMVRDTEKAEGDIADETLFLREGAAMKIKRGVMIKNGGKIREESNERFLESD